MILRGQRWRYSRMFARRRILRGFDDLYDHERPERDLEPLEGEKDDEDKDDDDDD